MGLRERGKDFLEENLRLGIPTLVVDLGWLRRDFGYWQVSLNGLNVAPPVAPDSERFESLNIKVFPPLKRNYHTLIVGQSPGDAQHDLETEQDVLDWGRGVSKEIWEAYPRRKIFWRPHPMFIAPIGKPAITTHPYRDLGEFLDSENVGSAVVYNSTLGLDLLRRGAHVVARGPKTVYTDLTSPDIEAINFAHPGPDAVRGLLERLSYGQYKTSELARWETLERLLDLHGVTGDWK